MKILKITLSIFLLTVSINAFADLNNGLIAYYPFNGNANDESGHNNNGIVHGASLTTDRFGNQNSAYSFNGSTNYIDLINKPIAQQGNNPRSIFVWCKTTNSKEYQRIVVTGDSGLNHSYNILLTRGQVMIMGYAYDFLLNNEISITDGKWHFIGTVYDGHINSIWVDGIFMGSQRLNYKTQGNNNFIGRTNPNDNYSGGYFNGSIDDIRLYNRALSNSEIKQLFTGKPEIVKLQGNVSWVGLPYFVECQNNTLSTSINISTNNKANYDCEKAGLIVNSGDNVSVTITGNKK